MVIEKGELGARAVLTAEPSSSELSRLQAGAVPEVVINDGLGWRGDSVGFLRELPWLKALEILALAHPLPDDSPVFELGELVSLGLSTYASNEAALGRLPLLKHLGFIWRKKTSGLDTLTRLLDLALVRYGRSDLDELTGMRRLRNLTILGGRVSTLHHLRSLPALTTLRIADLRQLSSLDGLEALTGLERLTIDGCKGIRAIDPIAGCTNLRELHLDNMGTIETLAPLAKLQSLRVVDFVESTNVEDGHVAFLREMGVKVWFQNRRHYDASREELAAR
jgi:Leucine-rich repeat (LRR) protein